VVLLLIVVLLLLGGVFVVARKLGENEAARRQQLMPQARSAFDGLRAELSSVYGIELALVSTRRTAAQQDAKVKAKQSATNSSFHLLGRAFDVQTGRKDPTTGKVKFDDKATDVASYKKLHEVAKRYGLEGVPRGSPFDAKGNKAHVVLADGSKIWDVYHLQFTEGLTFAQAKAADAKAGLA
jgi:hypothetical protein